MPDSPRLLDITRPVRDGHPVWPGDAPCRVGWTARRGEEGSAANVAELHMSAHTGTHADGPFHVAEDGARIGAAPLEAFIGPARVLDARDCERIDAEWLREALANDRPERVLFNTACWLSPDAFPTKYPPIHPVAAELLVEYGVRLVGTDAPSVDPFDADDLPAHRVLLGAGVALLENLLLDGVVAGEYELIALPLRLEDADASPVRAVLREA
ncbi:MAG TPA: cyclase family protein [Longimicrobium sp.]|nr:cyclase family protein [Longimicrobium sp.]